MGLWAASGSWALTEPAAARGAASSLGRPFLRILRLKLRRRELSVFFGGGASILPDLCGGFDSLRSCWLSVSCGGGGGGGGGGALPNSLQRKAKKPPASALSAALERRRRHGSSSSLLLHASPSSLSD